MGAPAKKLPRNLAEDIRLFRADLDVFISERVAELKKSYPALPIDSLRLDLMKHRNCQCAVVAEILEKNRNA
jgi:hypothetical protein